MSIIKKPKLVVVRWTDAAGWKEQYNVSPKDSLVLVDSVGWLINKDEEAIILCCWREFNNPPSEYVDRVINYKRDFTSIPIHTIKKWKIAGKKKWRTLNDLMKKEL